VVKQKFAFPWNPDNFLESLAFIHHAHCPEDRDNSEKISDTGGVDEAVGSSQCLTAQQEDVMCRVSYLGSYFISILQRNDSAALPLLLLLLLLLSS